MIYTELSNKIYAFIDKYAKINPNWDEIDNDEIDNDGKFTAPDVYEMLYCADLLSKGIIPDKCFSEWGGGYKPYTSIEGFNEHDSILKEIYKLIKK